MPAASSGLFPTRRYLVRAEKTKSTGRRTIRRRLIERRDSGPVGLESSDTDGVKSGCRSKGWVEPRVLL